MDLQAYQAMYQAEDTHWWYVGMQHLTAALIAQYFPEPRPLAVLDAGCGTGGTTARLGLLGAVTGCDVSAVALDCCRERGLPRLGQASVTALPFPGETFDLVTSFDVLYHSRVPDCRQALAEARRVLKAGGRIFIRVPAYDWLRGQHDRVVHTAHRFTATELARLLQAGGWLLEKVSYVNTLLFPVAAIKRLAERLLPAQPGGDIRASSGWQDALLARVLRTETSWLLSRDLPFGLTVLAIARKT